jgi:hypothetical protein
MAEALVSDDWAEAYFRRFPLLSGLEVTSVRRISPENFRTVLARLLDSAQQDFIIDAHGDPNGLFMPLVGGQSMSAVQQSLVILMRLQHARDAIARAGNDLERWNTILRTYGMPPQRATSVQDARASADVWTRAQIEGLQVTRAEADELLTKMIAVRAKELRRVEFRSCNMGRRPQTLREFLRFLGARHVGAPDVRSGFGFTGPSIGRRGVDAVARRADGELFGLASGRFALRIDIQPGRVQFDTQCAADTEAAVREWVAEHIMLRSRHRRGRLPIHVLETSPRTFPRDRAYGDHIKHASQLWWAGRVYEQAASQEPSFWERAAAGR